MGPTPCDSVIQRFAFARLEPTRFGNPIDRIRAAATRYAHSTGPERPLKRLTLEHRTSLARKTLTHTEV